MFWNSKKRSYEYSQPANAIGVAKQVGGAASEVVAHATHRLFPTEVAPSQTSLPQHRGQKTSGIWRPQSQRHRPYKSTYGRRICCELQMLQTAWVEGGEAIFKNVLFCPNYLGNTTKAGLMYETSVWRANSDLKEKCWHSLTQGDTVSKNNGLCLRCNHILLPLPNVRASAKQNTLQIRQNSGRKGHRLCICLEPFSTVLL